MHQERERVLANRGPRVSQRDAVAGRDSGPQARHFGQGTSGRRHSPRLSVGGTGNEASPSDCAIRRYRNARVVRLGQRRIVWPGRSCSRAGLVSENADSSVNRRSTPAYRNGDRYWVQSRPPGSELSSAQLPWMKPNRMPLWSRRRSACLVWRRSMNLSTRSTNRPSLSTS